MITAFKPSKPLSRQSRQSRCHNTLTLARTSRIELCHIDTNGTLTLELCHNTLTLARTTTFLLCHNTLTPTRTPRLGLCHNTLTSIRTPRLGLCHNTLTPARYKEEKRRRKKGGYALRNYSYAGTIFSHDVLLV